MKTSLHRTSPKRRPPSPELARVRSSATARRARSRPPAPPPSPDPSLKIGLRAEPPPDRASRGNASSTAIPRTPAPLSGVIRPGSGRSQLSRTESRAAFDSRRRRPEQVTGQAPRIGLEITAHSRDTLPHPLAHSCTTPPSSPAAKCCGTISPRDRASAVLRLTSLVTLGDTAAA